MRPHVACPMASSVDGRTLHSRWRPKESGGELFEREHEEIAGDAWLVGRITGQEFAKGKPYTAVTKETFPRQSWFARRVDILISLDVGANVPIYPPAQRLMNVSNG